jgi:DNA-3-methyladenine glycosylase
MLEPSVIEPRADNDRRPVPRELFARPTDEVARDLLGTLLCRRTGDGLTVGRIVEAEAYGGPEDLASHARAGVTRRTTPMFGEVGHAYIYLIYGMHECLNVVAHAPEAQAGAVLLRAIEPVQGVELMRARRARPDDPRHALASGPARLCQAMTVDRTLDGHDLTIGDALWLAARDEPLAESAISCGPRIGVDYAGEWSALPLRFWLTGNRSVSGRRVPANG